MSLNYYFFTAALDVLAPTFAAEEAFEWVFFADALAAFGAAVVAFTGGLADFSEVSAVASVGAEKSNKSLA